MEGSLSDLQRVTVSWLQRFSLVYTLWVENKREEKRKEERRR